MDAINNIAGQKKTSFTALVVLGLALIGIFIPKYQKQCHEAAIAISSAGLLVARDPVKADSQPQ